MMAVAAEIVAVPTQACTRTVAAAPSITAALAGLGTAPLAAAVAGLDQALAAAVRFAFALGSVAVAPSVGVLQSAVSQVLSLIHISEPTRPY